MNLSTMERFEAFFSLPKQQGEIFYQIWQPKQSPKAWLIITHGQGEHSDCYHRLATALADMPLGILAWDLRGHGRSFGKRGYAPSFLTYVEDLHQLTEQVLPELEGENRRFWLGHSLGGLILLRYALWPQRRLALTDGLILSNPFIDLQMPIPAWKQSLSELAYRYLPQLCLDNEITYDLLTRDSEVLAEYEKDPLRHHKINAPVFLGALTEAKKVLHTAYQIKNPALFQISELDPIVNTRANLKLHELYGGEDKTLKLYSERRHEPYNDLGREQVFADLKGWLKARL